MQSILGGIFMSQFTEIDIKSLDDNFFTRIGDEWMLVTAGDESKLNTMTASWGGTGILWNKPVAFSFIRQSRYTFTFMEDKDYYTLSFFGGALKKELVFCGRNSGRDVDKFTETGLTPAFDAEAPYLSQADLVFVCKKLYQQPMTAESFLDRSIIEQQYADGDWHQVFVGEIVKVLKKQ